MDTASPETPHTLLELGSGGGSLAHYLKTRLAITLSDRSAEMLAISRRVNPECEHVLGDMRSMDLNRQFDLVLIHDAIMYATDPAAVRATLATAHRHCRPGGAVVILPDCVRETFEPTTECGGEDAADGSGLSRATATAAGFFRERPGRAGWPRSGSPPARTSIRGIATFSSARGRQYPTGAPLTRD